MDIHLETAADICGKHQEADRGPEDGRVSSIAENAKSAPDKPRKPKIALIGDAPGNVSLILQETFGFSDIPIERTLREREICGPAVLRFEKKKNMCFADISGVNEDGLLVSVFRACSADRLDCLDVKAYLPQGNLHAFDWKRVLPKADYVFLAVSAACLLTAGQRESVEVQIRLYFVPRRFAVILTDMDKLNSPQACREARMRLSGYLDVMGQGIAWHELGTQTLGTFVEEQILGHPDRQHQSACEQTAGQ